MVGPGERQGIPSTAAQNIVRGRLARQATGVVQSDGTISFAFEAIATSQIWTGSITVPGALPNSILGVDWTAFDGPSVGSGPIGVWYAQQSSGTVQAQNGITVVGTGLTGVGSTLTAYFRGVNTDSASAPPWWPEPTPAPPPFSPFPVTSAVVSPAGGTVNVFGNIPVIPGTRTIVTGINVPGIINKYKLEFTFTNLAGQNYNSTFDFHFSSQTGNGPAGWSFPNVGPLLNCTLTGPGTNCIVSIVTGMPAETPIFQQNLSSAAGGGFSVSASMAGGSNAFILPSFVGPAIVSAQLVVGTAGLLDVDILSQLFDGTVIGDPVVVGTQETQPGAATIPPTLFYLPAAINTLRLNNRTTGALAGEISVAFGLPR